MGYVTVTETVGEVTKTYHFSSYDDFKDWENKISGAVVSGDQVTLGGDIWIKNTGEYPPARLFEESQVVAKFKNGETNDGPVYSFVGWNKETLADNKSYDDWLITHYRVVSK